VLKRWAGPLITTMIFAGVALILILNLNLGAKTGKVNPSVLGPPTAIERPIGEPVDKNHIEVAAVWLPAVAMDGMDVGGADLIHLEADVKATEGSPNGFALGEFVPYLKIMYTIKTSAGEQVDRGELRPMVAKDGLHYGANVPMPRAGKFRLTYAIFPPSAGGLGRHSDAALGVAPWWTPFEASFDWDYPGPPVAVKNAP
jgi:periplasmic iron binding protein